jgi:lipoic acid synthetase
MSSTEAGAGPIVGTGAQRGLAKVARARIPITEVAAEVLSKPDWIRVRVSQSEASRQGSCAKPACTRCAKKRRARISARFRQGTATFMVLGDLARDASHSAT